MIVLDTNVLLRYANTSDPLYSTADAAIAKLHARAETLCIVAQNLYEFWAAATRPVNANGLGMSIAEAELQKIRLKRLFPLLPDPPNLLDEWETLVFACACHGRVSYDARIVAAMKTHGIAEILTFNAPDFRRFLGLTILDPHSFIVP